MNEQKRIIYRGRTIYTKEVSMNVWNNLTPSQQIKCLEQAQRGDCSPPSNIPIGYWKAATHHMKYEGLAFVGHIEGGECEVIKLTDIGEAYLHQAISKMKKAAENQKMRESDAYLKLQGLNVIYNMLKDDGFIVDGYWEGSPSCFWTLVYELYMNHEIDNGGYAWTDVARWVNVRQEDRKRLIRSAQKGLAKNRRDKDGPKKSIDPRAAKIRAICKK